MMYASNTYGGHKHKRMDSFATEDNETTTRTPTYNIAETALVWKECIVLSSCG